MCVSYLGHFTSKNHGFRMEFHIFDKTVRHEPAESDTHEPLPLAVRRYAARRTRRGAMSV